MTGLGIFLRGTYNIHMPILLPLGFELSTNRKLMCTFLNMGTKNNEALQLTGHGFVT